MSNNRYESYAACQQALPALRPGESLIDRLLFARQNVEDVFRTVFEVTQQPVPESYKLTSFNEFVNVLIGHIISNQEAFRAHDRAEEERMAGIVGRPR